MEKEKEIIYCRYLRGKNAYGTMEGGDNPILAIDPRTSVYWCLCTMGPAGPDNRPVHPPACRDEKRRCFAMPAKEKDSQNEQE